MASRFARVRNYELMTIFHPEVEDDALAGHVDRVRSYITDVDGTVTVVNRDTPWGRRRLAYPIRHESRDLRDGIYVLIYFNAEASRTADIERELKLNTRVIRYMLLQQTTPTMEPPLPEGAAPAADGAAPAPTAAPAASGAAPDAAPAADAASAAADAEPETAEVSTVPDRLVHPQAPADPSPAEAIAESRLEAADGTEAAAPAPVFDDAPEGSAALEEQDAAAEAARASDQEELNRPSSANP